MKKITQIIIFILFTGILILAFIGLSYLDPDTQKTNADIIQYAVISAVGVSFGSFAIAFLVKKKAPNKNYK